MSLARLSFANIKMLADNIAEIVVDGNTIISLEMIEELESFLNQTFNQPFGLLVNKVNSYEYTFEAMTCMGSNALLAALAVVNYHDAQQDPINKILKLRAMDELNVKVFSALELGWQEAQRWLTKQLA